MTLGTHVNLHPNIFIQPPSWRLFILEISVKIIAPGIGTNTWTNIFDIVQVDPKYAHVIENVSSVGIRLALNNETLSEVKNCILLEPNEEFFIQPNWGVASVIAEGTSPGKISIRRAESTDIRSAMRKITGLSDPRILTQTLTQIEAASIEGRLFQLTVDVSIPTGATEWFEFTAPVDKECAFVDWSFSPFYTGFEGKVVTGSTGGTQGTSYGNRNLNLKYPTNSAALFEAIIGTPTQGTVYFIPVFIPVSGNNPNTRSAGISSTSSGYKIIPAGGSFRLQLINSSGNANRVVFSLTWLEAPPSVLS